MKKFYWLLLFISLFTGCTSKTSAVINKLENKTDQYTKLQKENMVLFCSDVDKILKLKKEDSLSAFLSESEAARKTRFEIKYADYIKNHTTEESIKYLSEPYFVDNLGTLKANSKKIHDFLENITTPPIEENVINYKITNLQLIWSRDTFMYFESYDSPERLGILVSNDLEWQKKTHKEIIDQVKEWMSKSKIQKN